MFLGTAAKIAVRELRAAPGKFLFVVLAVAVGVAALSGIKGFGIAFKSTLLHNSKQLIAADLQAQTWNDPRPDQLARVQQIGKRYGTLTRVTETISMAGSPGQKSPQLVSVKAVDPSLYPFYGKLSLQPAGPLRQLLSNDSSVVVTSELLIRLKTRPGNIIRLGGQDFRIAGTLVGEPDRLASGFGPGMRVLMSRGGLARAGLIGYGSRAAQRFLFRLRPGVDLDAVKDQMKSVFGRIFFTDYRQGSPVVGQAIDNTTTFLSLISLIALIVGALGVGMSIHAHVQQRLDTIGIMKAVGGRSNQVLQIYLLQTLCLGLTGGILGVIVGVVVQRAFPLLMQQVFSLLPSVPVDWSFAAEGLALGLFATLLFTVPALLAVRSVRPNLIFRREVSSQPRRIRSFAVTIATGAGIVAGFICIAAFVSDSWRMGLYFAGGLGASLLILAAISTLLLSGLRALVRRLPQTVPSELRHGIANLYRPGNHARGILVALGVGVMFTVTTVLLQQTVLREILSQAPAREGNLFLLDIRDMAGVSSLVNAQPGVTSPLELVGYVVARFVSDNGVPLQNLPIPRRRKDQAEAVRITTATRIPPSVHLRQGAWWTSAASTPVLAVSEEARADFHLGLGDRVRFQIAGRIIEAPVVAIFDRDERGAVRYDLVLPRAAMQGLPVVYYGTLHAEPSHIPAIEEILFEHFPTVTVMNLADVLKRVQEAVDQVAFVIRLLSLFAVAAGVIILASSIAGTRYRRVREIAILKALGATKGRIRAIMSMEFCILGGVAGLVGGLLANAFTKVIANKFIETSFTFNLPVVLFSVAAAALLANAAGWLASARILNQKPLEVLRGE